MENQGYKQRDYRMPVKRYCQVLDLKDDAELIAAYRRAHSREEAWPEIAAGIRAVGILEMELYSVGNKAVMIVDAPLDFDWDEAMARLATLPRQAEWEEFVARFQQCAPGSTSAEKWQMTERIFHLYE
jgi:L-rhamnose mutarotase